MIQIFLHILVSFFLFFNSHYFNKPTRMVKKTFDGVYLIILIDHLYNNFQSNFS